MWDVGTCWLNVKGREVAVLSDFASTNVNQRDGVIRSSDEAAVIAVERRDYVIQPIFIVNQKWEEQ